MKQILVKRVLLLIASVLLGIPVANGQEKGNASYYSHKLHGRKTSDGSRYHRDSLTCAHRTHPLGTLLKVRNPQNGKEVVVKVTDRGPYTKRFSIDLSYAAAKKLDFIRKGFTMVEITPYEPIQVPYRAQEKKIDLLDLELSTMKTPGKDDSQNWQSTQSTCTEKQSEEPTSQTPSLAERLKNSRLVALADNMADDTTAVREKSSYNAQKKRDKKKTDDKTDGQTGATVQKKDKNDGTVDNPTNVLKKRQEYKKKTTKKKYIERTK